MPTIVPVSPSVNKTLLGCITSVCRRLGLDVPTTVINSQDKTILQLLEMANEEGQELVDGYEWQILTSEQEHTTVAGESQGVITDIISGDYGWIINDTLWDRTNTRPVYGPMDAQQWQRLKGVTSTGPYSEFRIRGGELLMYPAPPAGNALYFEWVSKDFCQNSAGTQSYREWNADDDVTILDAKLMELGLVWRWKQLKGIEYLKDEQKYRLAVQERQSRDKTSPVLNTSYPGGIAYMPYPNIPEGSWRV
jgi:hypothetical protein